MEVTKKEMLELAVLGLEMKIEKKTRSISTGEKLIEKMRADFNVSMDKYNETVEKLNRLKMEVEELYKYKENLIWFDEIDELKIV